MIKEENLQNIYKHFGREAQIKKLREECQEFLDSENPEEIADLYVLARQFYQNSGNIRGWVDFKISRTLSRIESKYYEGVNK